MIECAQCKTTTPNAEYCSAMCHFKGNGLRHKKAGYKIVQVPIKKYDRKCKECEKGIKFARQVFCNRMCRQKYLNNGHNGQGRITD